MTRSRTTRRLVIQKPTILLLGGSAQNSDFVDEISRLNLRLVVVDKNPTCALAPTADRFINSDCRDTEAILEGLGSWRETIFAVVTFSELTESVAQLSQDLNLPGATKAAAELFQSKVEAKKVFVAKGVPTPPAFVADQINWETLSPKTPSIEIGAAERWILKPTSESGGRGISFHPTLFACLKEWARKEQPSRWLAEQVVDGIHIDGNAFIDSNGEFVRLGLSQRTFGGSGSREESVETPPRISAQLSEQIYRAIEKGARAAGVSFGPVKADVIASEQGVFVLEMATRLHGPKLSVTAFTHVYRNYFDVIFMLYWEAISSSDLLEERGPFSTSSELKFSGKTFLSVALTKPAGRVTRISRMVPFLNAPSLPRVVIFVGENDLIEDDKSRESAIGFVFGAFEDREFGIRCVRKICRIAERGIAISKLNDMSQIKGSFT